jgi:serine/threonine-protein kinase HipA
MGALQFKPARGPKTKIATSIELSQLVNQARLAVNGTIDDDDHTNAALRNIIEVGTSAGGARAKAVIAWNRDTQDIRAGQLEAAEGFEYWLLKFDGMGLDNELGASKDYGRIEYAYYLMAKEAGIDMMESRLLSENGRAHFMTKRFDREPDGVRHHVQTLCALSHLDYKKRGVNSYAQYFQAIDALGLPYVQKEEAFRRMVFNVMSRNCDDHTKNFSFRLRQGHAWELSPAYDITFAHNPKGEWTNQHLMSVNGKFNNITLADLMQVADRFGFGNAKSVITQVRKAIAAWQDFAGVAGLQAKESNAIGQQHILLN